MRWPYVTCISTRVPLARPRRDDRIIPVDDEATIASSNTGQRVGRMVTADKEYPMLWPLSGALTLH